MALSNSKSRALTARHHEKGLVAKEAPEGLERSAATCPSVSSPLCLYGKILGLNKVVRLEFEHRSRSLADVGLLGSAFASGTTENI